MSTQTLSDPTLVRDDSGIGRDDLGGKAASLAALGAAGFAVPRWLVVTPDAATHRQEAGGDAVPNFGSVASYEDCLGMVQQFAAEVG